MVFILHRKVKLTRKPEQSYGPADPRQQYTNYLITLRLNNQVTLISDLLTSESLNAKDLPCTVCQPGLVLNCSSCFHFTARTQITDPLSLRHTDTQSQTQLITLPTGFDYLWRAIIIGLG